MDAMLIRTDRSPTLVPSLWSGSISKKTAGAVDEEKESGKSQSTIVERDPMGNNPVPALFNNRLGKPVVGDLVQFGPELTHKCYGGLAERRTDTDISDAVVVQETMVSTQLFKEQCTMDRVALDYRSHGINKYKLVQKAQAQPGSVVELYV
jgi:hypothetical protein